jgi:hypothetical protein
VAPDRGKEEQVTNLVFTVRKRADLWREEFRRYWRVTHASLVKSKAGVIKVRRYV